jgi:hypothetical protein
VDGEASFPESSLAPKERNEECTIDARLIGVSELTTATEGESEGLLVGDIGRPDPAGTLSLLDSAVLPAEPTQIPDDQSITPTSLSSSPARKNNLSSTTVDSVAKCTKNLSEIVTFRCEDYTQTQTKPQAYDVILCMSVIKWIHINTGDNGVRKVFRKFWEELKEGGYLVLEPQPWSSYQPKKLSAQGKENYKKLELRPEEFGEMLKGLGFELVAEGKPEKSVGGFSARVVFTYRKTQT